MNVILKKDLMPELAHQGGGPHLTAYISAENVLPIGIGQQIDQVVHTAKKLLLTEYSEKEANSFLAPIQRLAKEQELLLRHSRGGWALFRSNKFFRLMRVPAAVKNISVVAQSFHIKPILKWMQKKEENYVLTIDEKEARIYESYYGELKHLDTLLLGKVVGFGAPKDKLHEKLMREQKLAWIDSWVMDSLRCVNRPLILAGDSQLIRDFSKSSDNSNLNPDIIRGTFLRHQEAELKRAINVHLHEVSGRKKKKLLKQLKRAELQGRLDMDLHSVARNAAMNRITRLYIAEDTNIWGVIDRELGTLRVHAEQLNCQDDDLLDDISEMVLKSRSEVVVLPEKEMPRGKPIAAILRSQMDPGQDSFARSTLAAALLPSSIGPEILRPFRL